MTHVLSRLMLWLTRLQRYGFTLNGSVLGHMDQKVMNNGIIAYLTGVWPICGTSDIAG